MAVEDAYLSYARYVAGYEGEQSPIDESIRNLASKSKPYSAKNRMVASLTGAVGGVVAAAIHGIYQLDLQDLEKNPWIYGANRGIICGTFASNLGATVQKISDACVALNIFEEWRARLYAVGMEIVAEGTQNCFSNEGTIYRAVNFVLPLANGYACEALAATVAGGMLACYLSKRKWGSDEQAANETLYEALQARFTKIADVIRELNDTELTGKIDGNSQRMAREVNSMKSSLSEEQITSLVAIVKGTTSREVEANTDA